MNQTTTHRSVRSVALDVVSFIARFYMAYIWIKAGWHKMGAHVGTAQSIKGYDIFSESWSTWLASVIGPLEIAGGVLLLLGIFLRQASKVGTVVLLLFIIGIGQAWARGLDIDCGCFAPADPESLGMDYLKTILRDVLFIALSIWTIYRPFKRFAIYV